MDPAIAIALVTGSVGTIGAIIKVVEVVVGKRPDEARVAIDRDAQISIEVWKYIDELKSDREDIRLRSESIAAEAARVKTDHELLQGQHQNSLLRIELLEKSRERDQAMILELQEMRKHDQLQIEELQQEVRQLKAGGPHG